MSYENFPQSEKPAEQPEPRKSSRNVLTGFLILALLATWGYIIYDNNQKRQEKDSLTAQIVSSDSAKNELQQELDDAAMRLDALKTSNARADSLLQTKDKDIQDLQSRIQKILNDKNATQAQLNEARRLIAQLKGNIDTYASEIESLKLENLQLTEKNVEITAQRDSVRRSYDSASVVISEKESIIDIGSTLHASNFKITGVQEKASGREKETSKAKKVDKIRITFTIDENRITQSGSKDIYIAITSPDGRPVTTDALGSGQFMTRDGTEKFFTRKVNIHYVQGQSQTVNVEWSQDSGFQTGNYRIEVYNNGFKIGQGTVNFRKGGLFG